MPIGNFAEWFHRIWEQPERLSLTILVILIVFVLRRLCLVMFESTVEDTALFFRLRKKLTLIILLVLLIIVILIWVDSHESFLKYIGVFGAGMAIAMHETIGNVAGWFFILVRKPFILGERIAIDGNIGDVIDINLLYFTIVEVGGNRINAEQSTGRIIHVPNSKVLRNSLINYNQGFNYIWHEICVTLTFESDWKLAKKSLEKIVNNVAGHYPALANEALKKVTRRYYLKMGKLTPIVYVDTVESGVRLSVRFLVCPREVRGIECTMWEFILDEFEKLDNINLAYQTVRFYTAENLVAEE